MLSGGSQGPQSGEKDWYRTPFCFLRCTKTCVLSVWRTCQTSIAAEMSKTISQSSHSTQTLVAKGVDSKQHSCAIEKHIALVISRLGLLPVTQHSGQMSTNMSFCTLEAWHFSARKEMLPTSPLNIPNSDLVSTCFNTKSPNLLLLLGLRPSALQCPCRHGTGPTQKLQPKGNQHKPM